MSSKAASIGDSGRAVTQMKILSFERASRNLTPKCPATAFVLARIVLSGAGGDRMGQPRATSWRRAEVSRATSAGPGAAQRVNCGHEKTHPLHGRGRQHAPRLTIRDPRGEANVQDRRFPPRRTVFAARQAPAAAPQGERETRVHRRSRNVHARKARARSQRRGAGARVLCLAEERPPEWNRGQTPHGALQSLARRRLHDRQD